MIYLKVAHTNDNDADYFKFEHIDECMLYMRKEYIFDDDQWQLSGTLFEEMPEDDYTLVKFNSKAY